MLPFRVEGKEAAARDLDLCKEMSFDSVRNTFVDNIDKTQSSRTVVADGQSSFHFCILSLPSLEQPEPGMEHSFATTPREKKISSGT